MVECKFGKYQLMAFCLCLLVSLIVIVVVVATNTTTSRVQTSVAINSSLTQEESSSCLFGQLKQHNFDFDKIDEFDELVSEKVVSISNNNTSKSGAQDTLRQVFIVHRHGDRTPTEFTEQNNLKDEKFWHFYGLGQLTNRGKQRLYLLGKRIRERYNNFMSKSVHKNLRKSRSSGSYRCIESAQVFLASFLGLNVVQSVDGEALKWSNLLELGKLWQPANIVSVPAKYDGMLAESSGCKTAKQILDLYDKSEYYAKEISGQYKHEARVLNESIGVPTNHFYEWAWAASQLSIEKSYFEQNLKPQVLNIYDRLSEAGYKAMVLYQSDDTIKRLRTGLLINDIVANMRSMRVECANANEKKIDSKSVQRFVHYCTHDINIVMLLGVFRVFDKIRMVPNFASHVIIELHQDSDIDEWYLKMFYAPEVPGRLGEFHFESCEFDHPRGRCTLDNFDKLTKAFRIDNWQMWMRECGNDLNTVDLYK